MFSAGDSARIALLADTLGKRGAVRLRVHGGSMWPWLRPGDELHVQRDDFSRLSPGAIVLFTRDSRLFAHRVIRRATAPGQQQLITKGDTLSSADTPVSETEFLGRVVALRRGEREIALDTLPQALLGRLCALLTHTSRFWYPLALSTHRLLRL